MNNFVDPSFVSDTIGTTTSNISSGLAGSIPLILAVFAGLVALGIAIHYVRKWIGRKA
jgi:hypothetical protein